MVNSDLYHMYFDVSYHVCAETTSVFYSKSKMKRGGGPLKLLLASVYLSCTINLGLSVGHFLAEIIS